MRHPKEITISAYIDGLLPQREEAGLCAHLGACEECRRRENLLRSGKHLLSSVEPIVESSRFDIQFERKLRAAIEAKDRAWNAKRFDEWRERFGLKLRIALERIFLPRPLFAPLMALVLCAGAVSASVSFLYFGEELPVIVNMVGTVTCTNTITGKIIALGEGGVQVVRAKTLIVTGPDGSLDLEIPGKYAVRIKENSALSVENLSRRVARSHVQFRLAGGKSFIRIEKGFSPSEFTLRTPEAEVRALGTKFSVQSDRAKRGVTRVGVLEGKVKVEEALHREKGAFGRMVFVRSGQETRVAAGGVPQAPVRMGWDDWRDLEELYQIGRKPQFVFLVANTPMRAEEMLKPAAVFISDDTPPRFPKAMTDAVQTIGRAIESKDLGMHLASIRALEEVARKNERKPYAPQLWFFTGVYYKAVGHHQDAISTFERVISLYPESTFASIAQCAIGMIYENELGDVANAKRAYKRVQSDYPDSLEAIWLEKNKKELMLQSSRSA